MTKEKNVSQELKSETKKWLEKIEPAIRINPKNEQAKEFLTNIRAYVSDCKHFLKEGNLIKGFEAVVWAWAWLEIGKELEIL